MSFNYDPYSGIELGFEPDIGKWRWHCHSCGGGWNTELRDSLLELWQDWTGHLAASHRLFPEDTDDWTKLE